MIGYVKNFEHIWDAFSWWFTMFCQRVRWECANWIFTAWNKISQSYVWDSFLRNIVSNTENVLFFLFMGGYTTAVMSSQNFFYVFDSHSRDERWLNIANERSVLLKFRYIFEIHTSSLFGIQRSTTVV